MENIIISGMNPLNGSVELQGSKNSALPILAAVAAVAQRLQVIGVDKKIPITAMRDDVVNIRRKCADVMFCALPAKRLTE